MHWGMRWSQHHDTAGERKLMLWLTGTTVRKALYVEWENSVRKKCLFFKNWIPSWVAYLEPYACSSKRKETIPFLSATNFFFPVSVFIPSCHSCFQNAYCLSLDASSKNYGCISQPSPKSTPFYSISHNQVVPNNCSTYTWFRLPGKLHSYPNLQIPFLFRYHSGNIGYVFTETNLELASYFINL